MTADEAREELPRLAAQITEHGEDGEALFARRRECFMALLAAGYSVAEVARLGGVSRTAVGLATGRYRTNGASPS